MKEVYTLYLLSPNKVSGNNYNATYNVNWYSFLPQKYNKFLCRAHFKSNPYEDDVNPTITNALLLSNIPLSNSSITLGGGSRTNCIGIAHVHLLSDDNGVSYYNFLESSEFEQPFTCCYPQDSSLTIQLTTLTGTQHSTLLNAVNYSLILTFEGIDE